MSVLNRVNSLIVIILLAISGYAQAEQQSSPGDDSNNDEGYVNAHYIPASNLVEYLNPRKLTLHSRQALIMDQRDGVVLYERKSDEVRPIASLTKLMTAMVTIDAKLPMDEIITITRRDRDRLRGSHSRLAYGTKLSREDLLLIALAASENRAAAALARTFPGGKKAFVTAMNEKAHQLGLTHTSFLDSTGLHSENVSTARELAKLVHNAYKYPMIREMSTTGKNYVVDRRSGWKVEFFNTNRLVRRKNWDINLSKTGYIADAGYCMVMQANINDRPLIIVLLNSWGKLSKFGDSNRIMRWIDRGEKKARHNIESIAKLES